MSSYSLVQARLALFSLVLVAGYSMGVSCSNGNEAQGRQTFTSPQSNPIVLSNDGSTLYVASTTSNRVDIIDTASQTLVANVSVGLEPVSLAVHPTADEVWVSNHVSDTVSVIDTDPASDTFRTVVQTIQDIDANGVSQFDEPVGIAFKEDGSKAYVALSSRNDIAVIDTSDYSITKRVHITAQEPRAIAVRNGRLFVAAFESFNQSELSICPGVNPTHGPNSQCTLDEDDLVDFVIQSPNIPGEDSRIVFDPDVPDRDLYVFNTTNEASVDVVDGVGTLLYGIVVDSSGEVFITQTDAQNEVNGGENDNGQNNLDQLDNRMFLNQIARVNCGGGSCGSPSAIELEPLPPSQPALSDALATPYGLAISDDDSTLVATAMGTSRVFTVRTSDGAIRDILDLDAGVPADAGLQIPKGVALASDGAGAPETAYVLNTLENTVSVVDVSTPTNLVHVTKIAVGNDPTPDAVRLGRIAFNSGFASTTGTFSCESCHPDGNTDQLLWRIGGACFFGQCSEEDEIRSTMPVRGLKNTLPLHWDGTLGDPFGGGNGAVNAGGNGGTDCTLGDADDDHDCFRDLVNESLQGVMCQQPCGGGGELSNDERDDMAVFLASVSYPPPRSRPIDDAVSSTALAGFSDFFVQQPGAVGVAVGVSTCADMDSGCHALPLGVDTNSSTLGGFDVPTMRGMTDRTLQFSIGITNPEEMLVFGIDPPAINLLGFPFNPPPAEFPWDPVQGFEEEVTYSAAFAIFNPVYQALAATTFQMFEEASVGHSGALGRQVTLNQDTTSGGALAATESIMNALEAADTAGYVNLRAVGKRNNGGGLSPIVMTYRSATSEYKNGINSVTLTHAQMISEAQSGDLVLTLTGALRRDVKEDSPMPLLSVNTTGNGVTGNPALPWMNSGNPPITLDSANVYELASVILDGAVDTGATLDCTINGVTDGVCNPGDIQIQFTSRPSPNGLHLVQVLNPLGLMSPELPICVGPVSGCQ